MSHATPDLIRSDGTWPVIRPGGVRAADVIVEGQQATAANEVTLAELRPGMVIRLGYDVFRIIRINDINDVRWVELVLRAVSPDDRSLGPEVAKSFDRRDPFDLARDVR